MRTIKGIAACKGIAIGPVFIHQKVETLIPDIHVKDVGLEWRRLSVARKEADIHLQDLFHTTLEKLGNSAAQIFNMHRLILCDGGFINMLKEKVEGENKNALRAVQETGDELIELFSSKDDEYMRERATDIRDIIALLLEILTDTVETVTQRKLEEPSIIFADDLTPSETMRMDRKHILAFVTSKGSTNSHTSILARIMGIPSIIQADFGLDDLTKDVKIAAIDGYTGICYLEPDLYTHGILAEKLEKETAFRLECEAVRGLPSVSRSGKELKLFANIDSGEDISSVLENDAEGIGLFRSEFLYLGRDMPPSEEIQYAAYKNVAEKMQGKKVIIRTMDIGTDKQAEYLGLATEENPALGYRAIRICLDQPELFRTQLRAICRASVYGNVAIMFPMISSLWEVLECKAALEAAQASLTDEGIPFAWMEVGIMIETPAAVILCDQLAKEVDFFSVGTNDLTQYTLAADRQNQNLYRYADPRHPAVLKMLRMIAECANNNGIWAGICGELAGDLALIEQFLEMGYSELSVAPPSILPIRKAIRECD